MNSDDKNKNNRLKPILAMSFLLVMLLIVQTATVSATEFDNTMTYNNQTETVTFHNWFGLTDIATLKLNSPKWNYVPMGYQEVAEFQIYGKTDYQSFIDGMNVYDRKANWGQINKAFDYKYKTVENVQVPNYNYVCSNVWSSFNNSYSNICDYVLNGTKTEQQIKWIRLTPSDLKKYDNLTIGVFTNVEKGDIKEWEVTMFGVKVDKSIWATWQESTSVGLFYYQNFSSQLASLPTETTQSPYNLTVKTTRPSLNQAGMYATGTNMSGSNGNCWKSVTVWDSTSDQINLNRTNMQFTINFWFFRDSAAGSGVRSIFDNRYNNGWYIHYSNPTGNKLGGINFGTAGNIVSVSDINLNSWQMGTITKNSSHGCIFVNGSLEACSARTADVLGTDSETNVFAGIGCQYDGSTTWLGKIDEIGVWNRSMTVTEVQNLYNSGAGIFYDQYTPIAATFNTQLITPSDAMVNNSQSIYFNCSATSSVYNVTNMSLWHNASGVWTRNQTITGLNANYTTQTFNANFGAGNFLWTCEAGNSNGNRTFATSNRTFTIDLLPPQVTIYSPSGSLGAKTLPYNVDLNYSVVHQFGTISSCYYNSTYNSTITILSGCSNATLNINSTALTNRIYVYANDSVGDIGYSYSDFGIDSLENSQTFNYYTTSGINETYSINFTYNSSVYSSISAKLRYNNTLYNSVKIGSGNNVVFNSSIIVPEVTVLTNKTFYWEIYFNSSYNSTSKSNNQSVNKVTLPTVSTTCAAGYSPSYYFNFKDEENFTILTNNSIDYILTFGYSNTSQFNIYGNMTNIDSFYICINSSINNFVLSYGEIQYKRDSYVPRRYYLFKGIELTNNTVSKPLYHLSNSLTTSFLFTGQSTALQPYTSDYISLLRWYPANNNYEVVEMGKTDDKGQSVMNIKTETVDYRIGIYYANGTLINLFSPIKFICQTTPCTYTLFVDQNPLDLTTFTGIQQSLTYDPDLKIITYIWNDPSLKTVKMNLTVFKMTGTGELIVCSTYASSPSGILSCNVSAYSGSMRAEAIRTASPNVVMSQVTFQIRQLFSDVGGGTIGLIFGAILVILLAVIGIINPVVSIILGIVALIPIAILGSISWGVFAAIGILGGVVLHFLTRTGK